MPGRGNGLPLLSSGGSNNQAYSVPKAGRPSNVTWRCHLCRPIFMDPRGGTTHDHQEPQNFAHAPAQAPPKQMRCSARRVPPMRATGCQGRSREPKPTSMAHRGGLRRKDSTEVQRYPTSPAQGCTSAERSAVHPQCDHKVAP